MSDLVSDAKVIATLNGTPPPMNFHTDFNIAETSSMQVSPNMSNDFSFLNKGPII